MMNANFNSLIGINMEVFVLLLAAVPVYLLRSKLGSGFFMLIKAILLWFLFAVLGMSLVLDIKKSEKTVEQESNKVDKKIYLKNITTGIKPNEISGIKYVVRQKTMDSVDVQILGKMRLVTLHKNDANLITKVVILGDDFESSILDMKNAIEERISKDNSKQVKLVCSQVNEGFYEAKTNICIISNDTQKLTLKYVKTKSAAYVNNFAWNIELEDNELIKAQKDKELEVFRDKHEKDKKSMQSQI